MEFSNKPFLRMRVQNLIMRPFQNLKSWDAFTSNKDYLDLISIFVWRHWRKEIGVKSWLHMKLISPQLSMTLEFCLMCRKEHLAVNIRPLLHFILLRRFTEIFLSLICMFLSMASEGDALMQKQYLLPIFHAQKPLQGWDMPERIN